MVAFCSMSWSVIWRPVLWSFEHVGSTCPFSCPLRPVMIQSISDDQWTFAAFAGETQAQLLLQCNAAGWIFSWYWLGVPGMCMFWTHCVTRNWRSLQPFGSGDQTVRCMAQMQTRRRYVAWFLGSDFITSSFVTTSACHVKCYLSSEAKEKFGDDGEEINRHKLMKCAID